MTQADSAVASIDRLIDNLHLCKGDQERLACLADNPIALDDLLKYHYFGVNSYGRNLVYHHPDFEIILMCWQPQQKSSIHDHDNSLCLMKCLAGELKEQRYIGDNHTQLVTEVGSHTLQAGQSVSITDEQGLHAIGNSAQNDACSLHVYFPPISKVNSYGKQYGNVRQLNK